MFLCGRTMFAPTTRVVDGADPYKIKPKYSQQKKQKICTLSRQRTYSTHARLALSAGVQACVHESARLFRVMCSHAW